MKLTVRTPCRENWNAMSGDDKRRFCGSCSKHVHHLSELTEAEATALVKQPGICGRFRQDASGRVVFADSGPTLTRLAKAAAAVVLTASVVSSPAMAGGQAASPDEATGNWLVDLVLEATGLAPDDATPVEEYPELMGDIAYVQPDAETRTFDNQLAESITVDCQGATLTVEPGTQMAIEATIGETCTVRTTSLAFVLDGLNTTCAQLDGGVACRNLPAK